MWKPLVGVWYFGRKDWISFLPSRTPVHDHKVPSTIDGSFISRRERTVTNYSGSTVWLGFLLNSPALLPFLQAHNTVFHYPKTMFILFCYFQKHKWCNSPALIRVTRGWLCSEVGIHASYSVSCISVLQFNISETKQNNFFWLCIRELSHISLETPRGLQASVCAGVWGRMRHKY